MSIITFEEKKQEIWATDLWRTDIMKWSEIAYDFLYYNGLGYKDFSWETNAPIHNELTSMMINQFPENSVKTVCVAGCGRGFSVRCFKEKGLVSFGCDISKWATDNPVCEDVIRADVANLPYENECCDIVVNSSVLEHIFVENFDKVCSELARVCKIGGFFLTGFDDRYDLTDATHPAHIDKIVRTFDWYRERLGKYFRVVARIELFPKSLSGEKWECLVCFK